MEASTITYSVSSCSDTLLEASKEFVIKLMVEEDGTPTMRRVRLFRIVDSAGRVSYERLVRLVSSKIRYSRNEDIRLSYLDVDEDCVIVDSSDELMDAIDQFSDQRVLRLFVGDVTPAMRQIFLAHFGDGVGKHCSSKKMMMAPEEIEKIIERQIEHVLEKRFRLLEQKRREQEHGGRDPSHSHTKDQFPPYRHPHGDTLRDDHHHPKEQQGSQQHHQQKPTHQKSPYPSKDPPRTPPNRDYGNSPLEEGDWYHSPIKLDHVEDDLNMIGDDDFLPKEDNRRSASVPRVRLPWENLDEDEQPPRPSSDRKPPRGNNHAYKTRHSAGGYNPRSSYGLEDEYDLSRMNTRSLLQQHRLTVTRRNNKDSPMSELTTNVTKRIHISRDPVQTLDTRYLRDPKARTTYAGPDHQIRGIDDLDDHRDDGDFRPEDPDPEEDIRDNVDDDTFDTDGSGGDDFGPHPSLRDPQSNRKNDDLQYLQDWDETNSADSDAELSLLLSDTEFVGDEITSRDHNTVASSKYTNSTASETEERQQEASEERQDENLRDGFRVPPLPPSKPPPPSPMTTPQTKLQRKKQLLATGKSPPTPTAKKNGRDLKPTIGTTSPKVKVTPPKIGVKSPKTRATSPRRATSPKSKLKPPTPRSNFNNIPRPSPRATKKNKLLGLLYN